MKKVFKEVNSLDRKCYDEYFLNEDILQEHAALGLKNALPKNSNKILIISGAGNNGADGIALARILHGLHDVSLYLPYGVKSQMAKLQLKRAKSVGVVILNDIEIANQYHVVVDALFGSGLNKPLDDKARKIIEIANQIQAYKIACDIPSGIDIDGRVDTVAFIADKTVTMGALKVALFSDEAKDFVGEIECADLGVAWKYYENDSDIHLLEESDIKLPFRDKKNTHKGNFGHLSVVAGKKDGSSIIAALGAFAFGAGLVTVIENKPYHVPPELMSSSIMPPNVSAVCIGMGLGNQFDDEYLSKFLLEHNLPMLIDADLFYNDILLKVLKEKKDIVLTPHPKEFASLLKMTKIANVSVKDIQKNRFKYALKFSEVYKDVVLVLKGANTLIVHNKKIYIQPFGTNALSKGGSGDVLGGFIASLLAQCYPPLEAAITGSLAHALSAKKFSKNNYALTPNDIIEGVKCL